MNTHRERKRSRSGAFTLIEAMVTLAIAGIVSAAAAATMALVMRTTSSTRASVTVANNMAQSIQFLSADIENAGGNGLPTQAALLVENDSCAARDGMPACSGNDRVTVFTAIAGTPVCTTRIGSRPNTWSFQYLQGGCCFPSVTPASTPVEGLVVLTQTGSLFRPARIVGTAGAVCEFDLFDVVPQDLYLNAPTPAAHTAMPLTDFTPFKDGQATLVSMRTFFVDAAASELRMKNGVAAGGILVADRIHDLQIALGHDLNGNGRVEATEFAWRESALPAATSLVPRQLPPREVLLSIVQGLSSNLRPDTVLSPLRPAGAAKTITAPGEALRAGLVRLVPYNSIVLP